MSDVQTAQRTSNESTPAGAPQTTSSGPRSAPASGGYAAAAAALVPGGGKVGKAKKPAPAQTNWSTLVRANFKIWDKDGDGYIGHKEANQLLSDPTIKGNNAVALAALHRYLAGLEELSNDEYGDENDGLTLADLLEYERASRGGKSPKDAHADGAMWAGKQRLQAANRVKSKTKGAKKGAKLNELFPNGAPTLSALKQGGLGDCYFLAAMASFINRDPNALVKMITRNIKKGVVESYTVAFPGKSAGTVTVPAPTDGEIARYSSAGADGLWLIVMEKAYSKSRQGDNIQEEIGEGGQLKEGIKAFTSADLDTDTLSLTSLSTTRQKLTSAFGKKKKLVTASIMSDNDLKLPSHHAYSVLGWNGTKLTIRNPWGSNPSAVPATATGFKLLRSGKFEMTLDKFDDIFSEISYEE